MYDTKPYIAFYDDEGRFVFSALHDELGWRARRHSYLEAPKIFFYLGTRILGYLKHSNQLEGSPSAQVRQGPGVPEAEDTRRDACPRRCSHGTASPLPCPARLRLCSAHKNTRPCRHSSNVLSGQCSPTPITSHRSRSLRREQAPHDPPGRRFNTSCP
jgi:hypothetical protein